MMRPSNKSRILFAALVWCACASTGLAQTSDPPPPPAAAPQAAPPSDSGITQPKSDTQNASSAGQDKRIFGVLPNYRTADGTKPFEALTTKQKFHIAVKDSFDYPNYFLAAGFAGLYQLENQNPSFGQGVKGYAHRYVTSYADQVTGNMMTEAIMPSLFHEDPRYFRMVHGAKTHRAIYALTRVLICKTDSNQPTLNVAELLGNGVSASLGNAYYPDERGFGPTMQRLGTAVATDAISNVLKEFWPDVKRHLFHKDANADTR